MSPDPEAVAFEESLLAGTFAQDIRREMEAQGVTQAELADRMGISQPGVADMLARENVTLHRAARAALALNRRLDLRLVERDEPNASVNAEHLRTQYPDSAESETPLLDAFVDWLDYRTEYMTASQRALAATVLGNPRLVAMIHGGGPGKTWLFARLEGFLAERRDQGVKSE